MSHGLDQGENLFVRDEILLDLLAHLIDKRAEKLSVEASH